MSLKPPRSKIRIFGRIFFCLKAFNLYHFRCTKNNFQDERKCKGQAVIRNGKLQITNFHNHPPTTGENEEMENISDFKNLNKYMNCKVCQKYFKTNTFLRHLSKSKSCNEKYSMEEITDIRKNLKKSCPKKSKQKITENNDEKTGNETTKKYKCEICDKAFKSTHILKGHICQNLKCDICDKKFSSSNYLKLHIDTFHNVPNNIDINKEQNKKSELGEMMEFYQFSGLRCASMIKSADNYIYNQEQANETRIIVR